MLIYYCEITSMNKIVAIKIFNDILDQLFDFLHGNFEFLKSDITLTRSTVDFIRKNNPRLVVEQFMQFVLPFKQQIFECDENFFLNFESNLSSLSLSGNDIVVGMKLKNVWLAHETTQHQKAYIWLFFQKLIRAGENVIV